MIIIDFMDIVEFSGGVLGPRGSYWGGGGAGPKGTTNRLETAHSAIRARAKMQNSGSPRSIPLFLTVSDPRWATSSRRGIVLLYTILNVDNHKETKE